MYNLVLPILSVSDKDAEQLTQNQDSAKDANLFFQ